MPSLIEWFTVRFDDRVIELRVHPPDGTPWEARIEWERLARVCFRSGHWPEPEEIRLFAEGRREEYVVPRTADGGEALWNRILERGFFDAVMASDAEESPEDLFCSRLRGRGIPAEEFPLHSPRQLPELEGDELALVWDEVGDDTVIRHGEVSVWRERAGWESYDRFVEIAGILKHRYGGRLIDLVPTARSLYMLYGDSTAATFHVASARESLAGGAPAAEAFYWHQLDQAILHGHVATIWRYLAQGGDPNLRSIVRGSDDTLLHLAAHRRRPDIARMLVAARANVNALDSLGRPPLVVALDTDYMSAVHLSPSKFRIDPEILHVQRTTALVKLLVFAGANLSGLNEPLERLSGLWREMYQPPLMLAARYGYTDALRFLLEHGAEVDVADHLGDTPLMIALRMGQAEAAHILIDAGADVNREPYSPDDSATTQLHMVIRSEHFLPEHRVALIRRMIEAGADVDKIDEVGDTPLLMAVRFGTDHYYAVIGFQDAANRHSRQVRRWPVQKKLPQEQIADIVRVLRAAGADSSARDRDGRTARDLAAEAGLTDLVAFL